MAEQRDWPEWWEWEVELTGHVRQNMVDRSFSETDLRTMLDDAQELLPAKRPGRWIAITSWHGRPWKVVLEPDEDANVLVVVTAYEVS